MWVIESFTERLRFNLDGGKDGVTCKAMYGGGTVTLQILAADGVSWEPALTAFTADGYATIDLPQLISRGVGLGDTWLRHLQDGSATQAG
jgi:hypothetical protein